jgi:hypothetical protein
MCSDVAADQGASLITRASVDEVQLLCITWRGRSCWETSKFASGLWGTCIMSAVFGFFCRLRLSTTSIGSSSLLKCAGFVSIQEKRKISKVHHYFAVLLFPVRLARACSMVCIWVELPLWIKGKVWTSLQNSINLQAQGIKCIDQAANFLDWSERSLRPSSPVARDVVAQESRPLAGLEHTKYYIWWLLVLGRRVWISGHVDAS